MTLPTHPAQVEDVEAAVVTDENEGKSKKKGGKKDKAAAAE